VVSRITAVNSTCIEKKGVKKGGEGRSERSGGVPTIPPGPQVGPFRLQILEKTYLIPEPDEERGMKVNVGSVSA